MTTCWSMWKLKSSSSPIAATGEAKAKRSSSDPGREQDDAPGGDRRAAAAQRPGAHRVGDAPRARAAPAAADRASSRSSTPPTPASRPRVKLFHYHLVTTRVREVEARYLGKLGFGARRAHGRIGEEYHRSSPASRGRSSTSIGFKLRLTELERGAVNVVVQPGQWELPARRPPRARRSTRTSSRTSSTAPSSRSCASRRTAARRTFIATSAGYRLEVHPPREWLDELLESQRRAAADRAPAAGGRAGGEGARCSRSCSTTELDGTSVMVGDSVVSFIPGGPQGRPQLHGELVYPASEPGLRTDLVRRPA